jgi:hypothetical protein
MQASSAVVPQAQRAQSSVRAAARLAAPEEQDGTLRGNMATPVPVDENAVARGSHHAKEVRRRLVMTQREWNPVDPQHQEEHASGAAAQGTSPGHAARLGHQGIPVDTAGGLACGSSPERAPVTSACEAVFCTADLLTAIFRFLSLAELAQAQLVCRGWYHHLARGVERLWLGAARREVAWPQEITFCLGPQHLAEDRRKANLASLMSQTCQVCGCWTFSVFSLAPSLYRICHVCLLRATTNPHGPLAGMVLPETFSRSMHCLLPVAWRLPALTLAPAPAPVVVHTEAQLHHAVRAVACPTRVPCRPNSVCLSACVAHCDGVDCGRGRFKAGAARAASPRWWWWPAASN